MKHRMLLITTGGTIAGQVADDDNRSKGAADEEERGRQNAADFLKMIGSTIDYLLREKDIDLDIKTFELCDVDSSDITPDTWQQLIQKIYDEYDNFDSFVITHGTNTLGYTCAALTFAIANSDKPIVVTGSQVPADRPGTDALSNLQNAIRVAVWRDDDERVMRGVIAVFGSHIISGTRVKKETEFDYDAFQQFQSASIGRIGRIIKIDTENLKKHIEYLETKKYRRAKRQANLIVSKDFDSNIASLTEFPGMDPRIFMTLVEHNEIRGFILRAFGAGDPAETLQPGFKYLKTHEIPIVVTTQAPKGNSNFQVNKPGQWLRENNMAIPAYDMSIEAQTAKLSWLLAKQSAENLSYDEVCARMIDDMRGEINVLWEINA